MPTLDIGSVLRRAATMYRDHWRPLLGMAVVVWLASAVVLPVLAGVVAATLGVAAGTVAALLGLAVMVAAQTILGGMYVLAVDDLRDGRQDRPVREYFDATRPKLGPLLLTAALAGLGVLAGIVLLVVPGLVLGVWWSLAAAVVMIEDRSGAAALARSKAIVAGHGWTMFGLLLVTALVAGAITAVLAGVAGALVGGDTVAADFLGTFANVVAAPFTAIVPVIAYYDLMARWTR